MTAKEYLEARDAYLRWLYGQAPLQPRLVHQMMEYEYDKFYPPKICIITRYVRILGIEDLPTKWREFGKYYGYPTCCVEQFVRDNEGRAFPVRKDPLQMQVSKNLGFIPCLPCAKLITEKRPIHTLITKRICPIPFPRDYQILIEI